MQFVTVTNCRELDGRGVGADMVDDVAASVPPTAGVGAGGLGSATCRQSTDAADPERLHGDDVAFQVGIHGDRELLDNTLACRETYRRTLGTCV